MAIIAVDELPPNAGRRIRVNLESGCMGCVWYGGQPETHSRGAMTRQPDPHPRIHSHNHSHSHTPHPHPRTYTCAARVTSIATATLALNPHPLEAHVQNLRHISSAHLGREYDPLGLWQGCSRHAPAPKGFCGCCCPPAHGFPEEPSQRDCSSCGLLVKGPLAKMYAQNLRECECIHRQQWGIWNDILAGPWSHRVCDCVPKKAVLCATQAEKAYF